MDIRNSSVAIVTDDGVTVSSHFGRARFYEVVSLSQGNVVRRERREKAGHHMFAHEHQGEDHGHHEHQQRHQAMVSPILDCQVVVARGMGQGAVDHLRDANILPMLTGLYTIDEVLGAIASGTLENDARRVHQHR
jgi:predicted Fe-Mo cluster-binding NifX family protein